MKEESGIMTEQERKTFEYELLELVKKYGLHFCEYSFTQHYSPDCCALIKIGLTNETKGI